MITPTSLSRLNYAHSVFAQLNLNVIQIGCIDHFIIKCETREKPLKLKLLFFFDVGVEKSLSHVDGEGLREGEPARNETAQLPSTPTSIFMF